MKCNVLYKNKDMVYISTEFGSFWGIWCSDEPQINRCYIIELDCDEIMQPNNVELSNSQTPTIKQIDRIIFLTALVEDVLDGVMILRMRSYAIMIEINDDKPFLAFIGKYATLKLNEIKLYDIGIY